jgi:YbgC/YbaW family acyl-CoA thioester hydrolase
MSSETPSIATPVQVRFFDTDSAGVVHNLAYLRFIETARTQLGEQLGLGFAAMAREQRFPVVVRIEADYKRPATLGERLLVSGQLERMERSRFWCAFRIERAESGELLVASRQMLALVQMPQGRPVRLPEDWATRFAHLRPSAGPVAYGSGTSSSGPVISA